MFPNRIRVISRSWLNTLLCVHLTPINVIISYDPSTNTYLEIGFLLRCFQKLSIPDIATGRSGWRQSPHTRGQFTPVLSYQEQIFSIFERLQKIGNQPVSRINVLHLALVSKPREPLLLKGSDYSLNQSLVVGNQLNTHNLVCQRVVSTSVDTYEFHGDPDFINSQVGLYQQLQSEL